MIAVLYDTKNDVWFSICTVLYQNKNIHLGGMTKLTRSLNGVW